MEVSAGELYAMIVVSNFFNDPRVAKEYRSLRHLARCVEQSSNPSKRMQRLLLKMQVLRFLAINARGMVVFDAGVFDAFVEVDVVGREWWAYFDNHTLFPRLR